MAGFFWQIRYLKKEPYMVECVLEEKVLVKSDLLKEEVTGVVKNIYDKSCLIEVTDCAEIDKEQLESLLYRIVSRKEDIIKG